MQSSLRHTVIFKKCFTILIFSENLQNSYLLILLCWRGIQYVTIESNIEIIDCICIMLCDWSRTLHNTLSLAGFPWQGDVTSNLVRKLIFISHLRRFRWSWSEVFRGKLTGNEIKVKLKMIDK